MQRSDHALCWCISTSALAPTMSANAAHAACEDNTVRSIAETELSPAVLFLDIDGVLHPVNAEEDDYFGGSQMQNLRQVVEATGAQVAS